VAERAGLCFVSGHQMEHSNITAFTRQMSVMKHRDLVVLLSKGQSDTVHHGTRWQHWSHLSCPTHGRPGTPCSGASIPSGPAAATLQLIRVLGFPRGASLGRGCLEHPALPFHSLMREWVFWGKWARRRGAGNILTFFFSKHP